MITIRLSGFPHEVNQFMNILKATSTVDIARVSNGYSNRNTQFICRYIDIEFTSDNDCPKLSDNSHSEKEAAHD